MTAERIIRRLIGSKKTLATAESLTGGLLSGEICAVSGASQCFCGGLCAYQDGIKARLLHVNDATLRTESAVSAACAREMARGARGAFQADYALSTTGYAGPTGEDVGLVYIGLSSQQGEKAFQLRLHGSRQGIRRMTVKIAFHILQKEIQNNGEENRG